MLETLSFILAFIGRNFLAIWPYLLITIPIAVAVNLMGASRFISRAFKARPLLAIFLATAVGAFSPFCSCTVIPVVAALLIGGVPLAPVMAFWVASPSMDPEIFFLSVATIGWELALWRMAATLVISLSAGFVTHLAVARGWLGQEILRRTTDKSRPTPVARLKESWQSLVSQVRAQLPSAPALQLSLAAPAAETAECCVPAATIALESAATAEAPACSLADGSCGADADAAPVPPSFRRRLLQESWQAASLVVRFMLLAFFLEALIELYVPQEWVAGLLGGGGFSSVALAAFIGVPVYTSNLTALPLMSGLMAQGMDPAAVLAFLLAGPMTTLPAMSAVWQLANRRVFALYVSFALLGAFIFGYLFVLLG